MTVVFNILKLKNRRVDLRKNQTAQEILLWEQLRREQLGYKFRRQHSIGGYVADFYCPSKKLVIEIDGSQHFKKESREYDQVRSDYFRGLNIKVLRFTNIEINTNIKEVVENIMNQLNRPPLIKGRVREGSLIN
jgi:very-short-patch-repair endonuclease